MTALRRELTLPRVGDERRGTRRHLAQDGMDRSTGILCQRDLQRFDEGMDVMAAGIEVECCLGRMRQAAHGLDRGREARGRVFVRSETPEQSESAFEGGERTSQA